MENSNISENPIGRRIEDIIEQKHISKRKFARAICFSPSHLSNVINGKSPASDRLLLSICYKYNININWLQTGIGEIYKVDSSLENAYIINILNELSEPSKKMILKIAELLFNSENDDKYE